MHDTERCIEVRAYVCPINWNLAGMPPRVIRARCGAFRYCPDPLGIVTAEQLDKLELVFLFAVMQQMKEP